MPAPPLMTMSDAMDSCNDFLVGRTSANKDMIRRAIHAAYRDVAALRDWTFLLRNDRVHLIAAEGDATCAYDHTGGAHERLLTIADATFDEDTAQDMVIKIGDAVHHIEKYKTSTTVTLDATMNPGQDVDAETACTIYPLWYALPHDFVSFTGPAGEDAWRFGQYISPKEMMALHRYRDTTGSIRRYTVMEVPDLLGTLGLFIEPPSDSSETCDFVFKRRPRSLRYSGHELVDFAGTIAVTAGAKTVTGTTTSFLADHVGSILRISSSTTKPTGPEGSNPYVEERSIQTVDVDAQTLTVDANIVTNRNTVKYVISDPIDLGQPAWDAFLRCCERHLANICKLEDRAAIIGEYREAAVRAKSRDAPIQQRRIAGSSVQRRVRLSDGPAATRDMTGYP